MTDDDDAAVDRAAYHRVLNKPTRLTMSDADIDAFADGVVAHRNGVAFYENPHHEFESLRRLSWAMGWNDRALKS